MLTVAIGWPLSNYVSDLRLARFAPDAGIASAAKAAFGPWHLVSLRLSTVTVCLAGTGARAWQGDCRAKADWLKGWRRSG